MKQYPLQISLILILLFFINPYYFGQSKVSPWVRVENNKKQSLRIDTSTLKILNDSDIYVWTLETHKSPIVIEEIKQNIFKTKTYYLLSKTRMKYTILEVVYYDSLNNVLKDFNYRKNINLVSYKYNFPILANSSIESILKQSIKYLSGKNEKKQ